MNQSDRDYETPCIYLVFPGTFAASGAEDLTSDGRSRFSLVTIPIIYIISMGAAAQKILLITLLLSTHSYNQSFLIQPI